MANYNNETSPRQCNPPPPHNSSPSAATESLGGHFISDYNRPSFSRPPRYSGQRGRRGRGNGNHYSYGKARDGPSTRGFRGGRFRGRGKPPSRYARPVSPYAPFSPPGPPPPPPDASISPRPTSTGASDNMSSPSYKPSRYKSNSYSRPSSQTPSSHRYTPDNSPHKFQRSIYPDAPERSLRKRTLSNAPEENKIPESDSYESRNNTSPNKTSAANTANESGSRFYFQIPSDSRSSSSTGLRRSRFDRPPAKRIAVAEDREDKDKTSLGTAPSIPASITTFLQGQSAYERVDQIGEGTYGKVYKARNSVTGEIVALKRIRLELEKDGFPITTVREIKILQSLRHKNIVRLLEMLVENNSVFMVFEYMDHDLTGVLLNPQFTFSPANIKHLAKQMFEGLDYLHQQGVLHRDIKGSNILLSSNGDLKFADFGLARFFSTTQRRANYTNRVITLWFRPPELLLGATAYGPSVDIWSAGCILMELFTRKPLFPGQDELHQLEKIFEILGTPSIEDWPEVKELPWYELMRPKNELPDRFTQLFESSLSEAALDLAKQLLSLNPNKRPSARQALEHPYFTSESPPPEPAQGLKDMHGSWHEWESKRRRSKKHA
ncbi:CMGC/CDK/CRK7 protein kinase Lsk1 [Schizosaccharomyces japonicus yFS275]|uniref:cyclin-dependent kinase n=1 Tax=Schizosaccharomyces japonicus (strain yFS275 / FY16936) TaxID=402676 RepID=B6K5J4_SCHJY|nr:CMGC/CDK/CRK7 protein kinase Lsk1 [Schizosaccharomyces japonicus yFS275]EEB08798.2 CMGC/CDK/CRK7 protein kinase Lsk1 [Schizosaccharomyces japonicus yFS275]